MNIRPAITRRVARRLGVTIVTAAAVALALPPAAHAHVSVQPGEVEGGGFSVVSFRVPNERDDASTTKVQVILPEDQPLGSVRTTPIPGWKVVTKTRTLDEPIEMFGEQLDTVVSVVTWTATGSGIAPGQYVDFDLNIGPLPGSGELVFTALQTYSSGEQVNWNEVSLDESVEPEHPAPVLSITAPAPTTEEAADESAGTEEDIRPAAAVTDDGTSQALPTALSLAALIVAVGALGVAWRRGHA